MTSPPPPSAKPFRPTSLSVGRADDIFTVNSVLADVWTAIKGAKAIVADCTSRNPNVFYEIGLAHVLDKKVVF
jgi:hypothetical protein